MSPSAGLLNAAGTNIVSRLLASAPTVGRRTRANTANNARSTVEPDRIVGRAEIYLGLVRAASPQPISDDGVVGDHGRCRRCLHPLSHSLLEEQDRFLALDLVKLVLFMTL